MQSMRQKGCFTSSTMIWDTSWRLSPVLSLRRTTPVVQNRSFVSFPRLISPLIVYPTEPSSTRSSDTRAETEIADIRRGCVTRMEASEPRPEVIMESNMNCGTIRQFRNGSAEYMMKFQLTPTLRCFTTTYAYVLVLGLSDVLN